MKTNISLLTTIAVLASALPVATNAATQVYDLNADWSDTANPNGTWSYRDSAGGLLVNDPYPWVASFYDPSSYLEAVTKITDASVVPGVPGTPVPGSLEIGDVTATCYHGAVVVRWTAPASGTIDISGSGWSVPEETIVITTGYSMYWTLSDNGSALSHGTFDGLSSSRSAPTDLSSGTGGANALLNIPVQPGDEVDLLMYGGPAGLNYTIAFTPDTVDPVTALQDLADTVAAMNLQNGIENSLDAKLDAALEAIDDLNANDDVAACNALDAFISAVEAQRGNMLTDSQANQLISSAQDIQAALNCGN